MTTFGLHPQQNQQWRIFDAFTMKSLTRSGASESTCLQASLWPSHSSVGLTKSEPEPFNVKVYTLWPA